MSEHLAWHGDPWHAALVESCAAGFREPSHVRVHHEEVDRILRQTGLDRTETAVRLAVDNGVLKWPRDDLERLDSHVVNALAGTVAVEAHLVRLAEALANTVIRWRVLKGAAIAHLDFRDPSLRLFGDVDLLIHSDDWNDLAGLLRDMGYVRPVAERRPGFDRQFGKGATYISPTGLELDLHLRFAVGRFGVLCRPDDMFAVSPEYFDAGGRQIPTVPAAFRWLHACFHEAIGGFRGLRAARDVAQLLLIGEVDWHAALRLSSAWGVDAVVAAALRDTWRALRLEAVEHPAIEWAEAYTFSKVERNALRVMRESDSYRKQAFSALSAIHGTRNRVRYLASLALPADRHSKRSS